MTTDASADHVTDEAVDLAVAAGRGWGALLLVCASLGFVASMTLTVDRIRLLQHPEATFVCDVSPFVACGPVMQSSAGALFGFPNPLLGIAGFAIVGATGAMVVAGARLARWYVVALAVAACTAAVLITWLQTQSLYIIGAICLWCVLVWAVTIPVVVTTISRALRHPANPARAVRWGAGLARWSTVIVIVWYLVIIVAACVRFRREILFAVLRNG